MIKESFDDAFDSDIIDYSSDYEKKDKEYRIDNWMSKYTSPYTLPWGEVSYTIKHYSINDDWSIEINKYGCIIDNSSEDNSEFLVNGELPEYIKFNKSVGDFYAENIGLKSLKGFPKEVYGDFSVKRNDIQSFEYFPVVILGDCEIQGNIELSKILRKGGTWPDNWVSNIKYLHDNYNVPTFMLGHSNTNKFFYSDDNIDNANLNLMVRQELIKNTYIRSELN